MHFLYGFHTVQEAWLNSERDIESFWMLPNAEKGFQETLQKAKSLGLKRLEPIISEKKKFEKILPVNAVHQGLVIKCKPLEGADLQDFVIKSHSKTSYRIVMLDQITDPHNVGAIIRSACVFGIDGIIMQKKHAPALDGILAKAASGGVEHIRVAYVTNLNRAIEELKEELFSVLGLDSEAPCDISDASGGNKLLMILGAEGKGIRHSLREKCDSMVKLPTIGPIASLNVSNAAAVAFYALSQPDNLST